MEQNIAKQLVGQWKNQLGSKFHIQNVDEQKRTFSGIYQTAVGKPEPKDQFIADGKYNIHAHDQNKLIVTFSVSWWNEHQQCNSVATWNGIFEAQNNTITTTWLLVQSNPSDWNSTITNKDVFTKIDQQSNQQ